MIRSAVHGLRIAARSLARSPGFSITAIGTLALGIGATAAAFSVFSTALLAPLPYPNADRLMVVAETRGEQEISVSWPDFVDWKARARTVEDLAVFRGRSLNLSGDGEPERLQGQMVTANLFSVLGVAPLLGRPFAALEDEPGSERVVALSYGLWRQRFAGDPGILGRSLTLNGEPHTVVAVMPDGFRFPDGIVYGPAQAWVPMRELSATDRSTRNSHPGLMAVALLRSGLGIDAGRGELTRIQSALAAEYPQTRPIGIAARSGIDAIVGDMKGSFATVLGAAGILLFIACANVAGLLLARASARRRDVIVRTALGASRRHLLAELLAEGSVLAGAGGVLGMLLAFALVGAGRAAIADLPRLGALQLDGRALLLIMVLVMAVAVVFALVPALFTSVRPGLVAVRGTTDPASARARRALVGGQMALALVVLISATLLARSFAHLRADRGGVDPGGVISFAVSLPESRYDDARSAAFFRGLQEDLGAIPGVLHASAVSVLPFSGSGGSQSGIRPGHQAGAESERTTDVHAAAPDYFQAMGIELLRGRTFEASDNAEAPVVAVVDELFAAANWPGEDPIGKQAAGWGLDMTVIGVVRHVKSYGVAAPSRQQLYVPHAQRPYTRMFVVLRTSGDPRLLLPAARRALAARDAGIPMYATDTIEDLLGTTVAGPRLVAFLASAFGTVALVLAAVGLYGLMTFLVASRTREIGVRLALGATSSRVLRLIVRQSLVLTGAGLVVGLGGALALTRLLRNQLYGVSPSDPVVFVAVPVALLAVALLACLGPAVRAARITPVQALIED